jgi:5-formyltetrahydrofolate cyclo-ligase
VTKEEIRGFVRRRRRGLDPAWVAAQSRKAAERVAAIREFEGAQTVCLYLSVGGEVSTRDLLDVCREKGKAVLVPAARDGAYALCRLEDGTPMRTGACRVPEPCSPVWADPACADVVVVPGVAFDRAGGRVGHGGGHYDRMLAGLTGARRVGLGFDFQLLEKVPMEVHDQRMDVVVTPSRTVETNTEGAETKGG